jgi:Icc-related predicted phosphoesterase
MRILSDLHLEVAPMDFPVAQPEDADTVLVLAGDIAKASTASHWKDFIIQASDQFKHVIWIMGNHEHWDGSINRSIAKIKRELVITQAMEDVGAVNISVVENEVVSIENTDFVCATLWTDFANHNPMAMWDAQREMRDYIRIREGRGPGQLAYQNKLTPAYTYACHQISRKFIERAVPESKEAGQKVVVVTHHGPSYQSIDPGFRGDRMNFAYVSPLDMMVEELGPDYWIHGHVHCTHDYNIGVTNVLCNPRGYGPPYNELNPEFDPLWTIDLS